MFGIFESMIFPTSRLVEYVNFQEGYPKKENSTINFQVRTVNFVERIFFCFRRRSQHMQESTNLVMFFDGHTFFSDEFRILC